MVSPNVHKFIASNNIILEKLPQLTPLSPMYPTSNTTGLLPNIPSTSSLLADSEIYFNDKISMFGFLIYVSYGSILSLIQLTSSRVPEIFQWMNWIQEFLKNDEK